MAVTWVHGLCFLLFHIRKIIVVVFSGPSEDCDNFKHELRGVIPRSFEHLFNLISREHELVSDCVLQKALVVTAKSSTYVNVFSVSCCA